MQGIFDASLLLFHFDLGRRTNFDDGNTARQLGHALLELLAVVVRGGVFDLHTDLADAAFNRLRVARTVNDSGVVLVHGDALGVTKVLKGCTFEVQTYFLRDHRTAGQNCDVLQHGLAAIAETRRLTGRHFNDATHIVHNQCRERLALDVLSNDNQRP